MGKPGWGVAGAQSTCSCTALASSGDIQTFASYPPTWDLCTCAVAPGGDKRVDGQGSSLDSGHTPEASEQAPPLPGGPAVAGTGLGAPSSQV